MNDDGGEETEGAETDGAEERKWADEPHLGKLVRRKRAESPD
jgi:hypothetical protein